MEKLQTFGWIYYEEKDSNVTHVLRSHLNLSKHYNLDYLCLCVSVCVCVCVCVWRFEQYWNELGGVVDALVQLLVDFLVKRQESL